MHPLGIDQQLVDHARQAASAKSSVMVASGPMIRSTELWRDVALVPQRDIFHRRHHGAAHHAGEAGQVLGQHRVALVRHRREPFCPGEKYSSASSTSVRCKWRTSTASARSRRRSRPASRRTSRGGRAGSPGSRPARLRPSFAATCSSTRGSILAKVPTAPEIAQVAISDARGDQARLAAGELGIGFRQLEAEGHRLGMDAVAAADGGASACARRRGA
jgi:hypothetical protein